MQPRGDVEYHRAIQISHAKKPRSHRVLITADPQRDQVNVCEWLNEFGLKAGDVSVSMVTDAESAVSVLVSEAGRGFSRLNELHKTMKRWAMLKEAFVGSKSLLEL